MRRHQNVNALCNSSIHYSKPCLIYVKCCCTTHCNKRTLLPQEWVYSWVHHDISHDQGMFIEKSSSGIRYWNVTAHSSCWKITRLGYSYFFPIIVGPMSYWYSCHQHYFFLCPEKKKILSIDFHKNKCFHLVYMFKCNALVRGNSVL